MHMIQNCPLSSAHMATAVELRQSVVPPSAHVHLEEQAYFVDHASQTTSKILLVGIVFQN